MNDLEKYQHIDKLIQKFAQTGGRTELDKFSVEDLKKAKAYNHANYIHAWYENYNKLIDERIEFWNKTAEAHKHYRAIAIGYTATAISLSLLQIKYLFDSRNSANFVNVIKLTLPDSFEVSFTGRAISEIIGIPAFALTMLLCLLSQFLIFKGYFNEARGNNHIANNKYFSPADKIVDFSIYVFLFGSIISLTLLLKWASLMAILPFFFLWIFFYRGRF